MDHDPSIIQDFLIESHENLGEADQHLLRLEEDPQCQESLAAIFRAIHTIKGTSSFLGFGHLEKLAHSGETLMSRLRDGEITCDRTTVDTLLLMVDTVREILGCIETTESDGQNDYSALIDQLERLHSGTRSTEESADSGDRAGPPVCEPRSAGSDEAIGESPSLTGDLATGDLVTGKGGSRRAASSTVRVDIGLLDKIMDLVGELVLARNQIIQLADHQTDPSLLNPCQRLNIITSELQQRTMDARMQPIGRIWDQVPRIVRDLATRSGKNVQVTMVGRDTDLDRSLIESVKDPLIHLVRNCVDHGIEPVQERLERGKAPTGQLLLKASHESGHVIIELHDDGRGIDIASVRRVALQKKLVDQETADRMSTQDWFALLFEPGFSTAGEVTTTSGRGVGLDVVKTNVEQIGGTIELESEPGAGTIFRLGIPLTLAIIPALIVTVEQQRYAIPQANILELTRLPVESIFQIEETYVCRLRGKLLPLVKVSSILRSEPSRSSRDPVQSDQQVVVIVETGSRQIGLVVDAVHETEEIVVKPLSRLLGKMPIFAGATVLGNSEIALILNVSGIAQRLEMVGEEVEKPTHNPHEPKPTESTELHSLILAKSIHGTPIAVPVETVVRLEEFQRTDIQPTCGQFAAHYHGGILPLFTRDGTTWQFDAKQEGPLSVVVVRDGDQEAGLVVGEIQDIVRTQVTPQTLASGKLSREAVVIGSEVTELVDVRAALRAYYEQYAPSNGVTGVV